MVQIKTGIQCIANRLIVNRLQDKVDEYVESQKERLVMTYRIAIRSITNCSTPIRCKEDALKLKGIGELIATQIESILRRGNILNVEPSPEELVAEQIVQPEKKSDISSYVPRSGSSAFVLLLSAVMLTCELRCVNISVNDIQQQVEKISSHSIGTKKLRETLKILTSRGLLRLHEGDVSLTATGQKLGKVCIEECRLQFPAVQSFMEDGLLDRLAEMTCYNTVLSQPLQPSMPSQPQPSTPAVLQDLPLELPKLTWPLSPPSPHTLMGETMMPGMREGDSDSGDLDRYGGNSLCDCACIHGREYEWEVVCVVDNREVRTKEDRDFIPNQLRQAGVTVDVGSLALGDMQWVLRRRGAALSDDNVAMLNTVVERKNTRDLAQSIIDGRFNEQQYRMMLCGVQHKVYLIEGGIRSQDVLPAASLQTSIVTTVINRGIYVYQSTSIDDTVVFLKGINERIKVAVHQFFELHDESCFHSQHMSYTAFQKAFGKSKGMKLRHLWCRQLRQIPGCTVTKTQIIARKYPTMISLLNAYSQLQTVKEKEGLLKGVCDKHQMNAIGPALSRYIYHFLTDMIYET